MSIFMEARFIHKHDCDTKNKQQCTSHMHAFYAYATSVYMCDS